VTDAQRSASDPSGRKSEVEALREFDWSGLAKGSLFTGQLAGIVGTIVGLSALSGQNLPPWLLVDPWLSAACVVLAFTRVWKTSREEQETMHVWERASHSDKDQAVLDRVVEIPYVFLVLALPLTATLPQVFMLTLLLFYLFDNYYNAALARITARAAEAGSSAHRSYAGQLVMALRRSLWLGAGDLGDGANDGLPKYFRTRSRYNSVFIAILFLGLVAATWLKVGGWPEFAWVTTLVVLVSVLLSEWLVEPRRNRDVRFEPDPAKAEGTD
jgi:hypothetical protein